MSIGVASLSEDIKSDRELIAAADKALYKAKESGRNKVCCFKNGLLKSKFGIEYSNNIVRCDDNSINSINTIELPRQSADITIKKNSNYKKK